MVVQHLSSLCSGPPEISIILYHLHQELVQIASISHQRKETLIAANAISSDPAAMEVPMRMCSSFTRGRQCLGHGYSLTRSHPSLWKSVILAGVQQPQSQVQRILKPNKCKDLLLPLSPQPKLIWPG